MHLDATVLVSTTIGTRRRHSDTRIGRETSTSLGAWTDPPRLFAVLPPTTTNTTATPVERAFLTRPPTTNTLANLPLLRAAQVYIELTRNALENPSAWVGQEAGGANSESDGSRRGGGENGSNGEAVSNVGSMSPESLLSIAEMHIDRALAMGSGLPLARLVTGNALVLRGQHKVKK